MFIVCLYLKRIDVIDVQEKIEDRYRLIKIICLKSVSLERKTQRHRGYENGVRE
jgi:hypothetical protein